MESQSKVRGGGTITALLFKPRNVQVRLPPPQTRPRPSPPRLPHACGDRAPIGVRYDPRGCALGAESSQLQLPPSGVAVAAAAAPQHAPHAAACVAGLAAALCELCDCLLTVLCVRPGALDDGKEGQGQKLDQARAEGGDFAEMFPMTRPIASSTPLFEQLSSCSADQAAVRHSSHPATRHNHRTSRVSDS